MLTKKIWTNNCNSAKRRYCREVAELTAESDNEDMHESRNNHNRSKHFIKWLFQNIIVVANLTINALTLGFAFVGYRNLQETLEETRRQANAAVETFALANPPRYKASAFVAYPKSGSIMDPPTLKGDNEIAGQFYFTHVGRTDPSDEKTVCVVYWSKGPLPMFRPYDEGNGVAVRSDGTCIKDPSAPSRAAGGDFVEKWIFNTRNQPGRLLNVMGYRHFRDKAGGRRLLLFARRYDPSLRRFVVADPTNTDYETEE